MMHRDLHDVVAASIQFGDSILALRAFQHSVAFHVPGNKVSLTFKGHHLTPISICQCLWSASSVWSYNPPIKVNQKVACMAYAMQLLQYLVLRKSNSREFHSQESGSGRHQLLK